MSYYYCLISAWDFSFHILGAWCLVPWHRSRYYLMPLLPFAMNATSCNDVDDVSPLWRSLPWHIHISCLGHHNALKTAILLLISAVFGRIRNVLNGTRLDRFQHLSAINFVKLTSAILAALDYRKTISPCC